MSENKTPSGIDRYVGQRIRWRRRELKLTQEKLGELLQLTFQQVQKYEKGTNRISAGRLFELSSVLGVPVSYFYDGADKFLPDRAIVGSDPLGEGLSTREIMSFISALQSIDDAGIRKAMLDLVQSTALRLNADPEPFIETQQEETGT